MPEPVERATLTVSGRVVSSLPNALYKVEIEGEQRQQVTAHVAGTQTLLRLLPGDPVVVELMAYDTSRGRILRRRA